MKRRQVLVAAGALVAAPLLLHAQARRVARVGILASARAPTAEEWARSPFRIKLNELGWVEGHNLKIEHRDVMFTIGDPVAMDRVRNPGNSQLAEIFQDLQERARASGVELRLFQVARPADIEPAFAEIARARIQGLADIPDPMTLSQRRSIADPAARHRLPATFESSAFAEAGGLLTYGPAYAELSRRVAVYVDKILLTVPQSILLRADRVLE